MTTMANNGMRAQARVPWIIFASILVLLIAGSPRGSQAQAGPVTDDNVAERVAAAKTAEDHTALAAFYRAQAAAKADDVKRHEAMLKSYEKLSGKGVDAMRSHCKALISSYRQEQKAFEDLAQDHEKHAKDADGAH